MKPALDGWQFGIPMRGRTIRICALCGWHHADSCESSRNGGHD